MTTKKGKRREIKRIDSENEANDLNEDEKLDNESEKDDNE